MSADAITADILLAELVAHGEALADAAGSCELDAPAPGLDWSLREVAMHVGAVHRWAADIVGRALASNETGGSAAFHPERVVPDAELADWLRAGHADLVATLQAAPDDLAAWSFIRGAPARPFWIRRQSHETAIHLVDLTGDDAVFSPEFAADGIAELVPGFARNRAFASTEHGTLVLAASDGPSWRVRFGGERIEAAVSEPGRNADATVSGTSSELYRWVWNRPSNAVVTGDADVAALWRRVRI